MKRKKSLRRIAAILLAFILAVIMPGNSLFNKNRVVKAAEWTATTLVSNGDFSNNSWTEDTSNTMEKEGTGLGYSFTTDGDTHGNFLYVYGNANTASLKIYQNFGSVNEGKYRINFDYFAPNWELSGLYIKIINTDTNSEIMSKAVPKGTYSGEDAWLQWESEKASFEFTLDSTSNIKLEISGTTITWVKVGIDNIVIEKYSENSGTSDTHGTLVNGDFAISGLGWTINDTDKAKYKTTDDENNGSQALKFNNWGAGADTHIKVTQTVNNFAAGEYQLKYIISGENSTVFPFVATVSYGTDSTISSFEVSTTGWGNWVNVSTPKFTVAEGDSITVTFEGDMPDGYWGWLDDVKIDPYVESTRNIAIDTTPTVASPVESELYVEKVNLFDGFITGFDISSYRSIKNSGASFKDEEGNVLSDEQFFAYLKSSGVNWVRIRVWVDPKDGNGKTYGGGGNDLAVAKDLGKLATGAGIRVLIDFHYSDFWTNPGKQNAPKEWKDLGINDKADRLQQYTIQSLNELIEAGVDVGMVQIGNETNDGFCGETTMAKMCKLFAAGSEGVQAVEEEKNKSIMIAIHVADPTTLDFDSYAASLENNHVVYDVFATSYYPYWHGTLENLEKKLSSVAKKYNKYVMVAETSYVNTLDDGDGHENTESKKKLDTDTFPYPICVQGQALHVRNVVNTVAGIKDSNDNQKGIGVFYWEPAWIPVNHYDASSDNAKTVLAENKAIWEEYGSGWATSAAAEYDGDVGVWYGGSAVDNEGVFDFDGKALETVKIYKMIRGGTTNTEDYVLETKTSAEFVINEEMVLPDTVNLFYASGKEIPVNVIWNEDELEAAKANGIGEYIISGTTEEYDGQTHEAKCTLKLNPINLLINPSFENPLEGNWVLDDSGIARKNSSQDSNNNIRTGSYNLHFYLENGGEHTFYQTLKLDKGIYRAGGYLSGDAKSDDTQIVFFFKVGDTEYTDEGTMTGWNNWSNPEVSDIEITEDSTEVTIGIRAKEFGAKAWGAYEDFYIYKTDDIDDKPTPEEPAPEEPTPEEPTVKYLSMYRLYNPNSGEHFYTSNEAEKNNLVKLGWKYEGVAWNAPETSDVPVYRLYNPNAGDHHYTVSEAERDFLVKVGWKYEGIGWYSESKDGNPVYRLYNPNAKTGTHHYTVNKEEKDFLVKLGWRDEGTGWYGK